MFSDWNNVSQDKLERAAQECSVTVWFEMKNSSEDVLNGSGEGKQDEKPAPPLLNTSAVKI